jgi:hypothetical protein
VPVFFLPKVAFFIIEKQLIPPVLIFCSTFLTTTFARESFPSDDI